MSTLAEVESVVTTFSTDELEELERFIRHAKSAKAHRTTHSIADIKPSNLGPMLRPFGTRDEWYDEMMEDRI